MATTSQISYDNDHPHEMKMVWDAWLESIKDDDLPDTTIEGLYHLWLSGGGKLIIDQKVWNRIVVTYL